MRSAGRALAAIVLSASGAAAQQYVISTVAGGSPPPTPTVGVTTPIGSPFGIAADPANNVYFTSCYFHCGDPQPNSHSVLKLDQSGVLTRIAGTSRAGYSGDGGPAVIAQLYYPKGVAMDGAGNLFIADTGNNRIRRVSPSGIITTVVGNGAWGFSGDGGPATSAQLSSLWGVAVDGAGNLFITDAGRIRKVSTSGIITTVAGNGEGGDFAFSGDGGTATNAELGLPVAVAVDAAGNLFIAAYNGFRIRKVSTDGIITTVAGNGTPRFSGDGGRATDAELGLPIGLAVDGAGNLFLADYNNWRVRKVSPTGIITTVAGIGRLPFSGDGGPAAGAALAAPFGVAVDGAGDLFIAEYGNRRIRKVSPSGIITTVAGTGGTPSYFSGDGGSATSALLDIPYGVTVDAAGNLFIADSGNGRVRKISTSGIITTVAGNGSCCDSGPAATSTALGSPRGLAVDGAGNLFIVDYCFCDEDEPEGSNVIHKVSPNGILTAMAGGGTKGLGDGGPATSAQLNNPTSVAVDAAGNLFIADFRNNRIRKVTPVEIITTVAGNGTSGFSGDNGPATSAQLNAPFSVAVDGAGNLFIAEYGNRRIRKVSSNGTITTVAGDGTSGFSGDGGPATSAQLYGRIGLAADSAGNLFLAETGTGRVRKISTSGIITTVAGNGSCCYSGDGGPATTAALGTPTGVAVDGGGNVYIADAGDLNYFPRGDVANNAVRILRPSNQSVLLGAVVDAANQRANAVSPGKIVVIYGAGLGPSQLIQNRPINGQFGSEAGGTTVSFNGVLAPVLYTSGTQVAAIVPYAINATTAQVTVSYQGQASAAFPVSVAPAEPGLFTLNQTGAGQAAAINGVDGTVNTAANPVKIGGFISLYATGEGQTTPGGVDGRLGGAAPGYPVLPVSVTIGGIAAPVQYAGSAPGQVAGLMQVNVRIPGGVQPGGYVPVVLRVGNGSTTPGAIWIAVSAN